mmetsp:Transcript_95967/g.271492  ORF Transcript_95967/g.271492 Transcript_95967/m.271492 type:complete len:311 (+) Transcript_95967:1789-2721(+)
MRVVAFHGGQGLTDAPAAEHEYRLWGGRGCATVAGGGHRRNGLPTRGCGIESLSARQLLDATMPVCPTAAEHVERLRENRRRATTTRDLQRWEGVPRAVAGVEPLHNAELLAVVAGTPDSVDHTLGGRRSAPASSGQHRREHFPTTPHGIEAFGICEDAFAIIAPDDIKKPRRRRTSATMPRRRHRRQHLPLAHKRVVALRRGKRHTAIVGAAEDVQDADDSRGRAAMSRCRHQGEQLPRVALRVKAVAPCKGDARGVTPADVNPRLLQREGRSTWKPGNRACVLVDDLGADVVRLLLPGTRITKAVDAD